MNETPTQMPSVDPSPARAALLEAAQELFLEQGFAATRVEDIAARAGVSKGTVYLYFRTKRELFGAVVESGVVERIAGAEQFAAGFEGSATELLGTMLRNNLLEFWGSPSSGILQLIVAEAKQFPEIADAFYTEATHRARQLLVRILQLGIDSGEFRQVDTEFTARCILNALDFEIVLAHALGESHRDDFHPERYIDTLLELITGGVAAESAP